MDAAEIYEILTCCRSFLKPDFACSSEFEDYLLQEILHNQGVRVTEFR